MALWYQWGGGGGDSHPPPFRRPAKGAGRRRLKGASNLTSVSADEGTECPRRSAVRAPLEVAISRELIRNVVPLMI